MNPKYSNIFGIIFLFLSANLNILSESAKSFQQKTEKQPRRSGAAD